VCVSPAWQALGKTALQSEYSAVLCRLWGRGWQSRCRAGLGTAAQHDGALAGLCRPGGGWRVLAEIIGVCGSLALRAHPMQILQV
jgi:hypothetical protein